MGRGSVLIRWRFSSYRGRVRAKAPVFTRGPRNDPLLSHLIRAQPQRLWNCESEIFRGLEIDHRLELRRLLPSRP